MELLIFILLLGCAINCKGKPQLDTKCSTEYNENNAHTFLSRLNEEISMKANEKALAEWAYASNLTDENLKKQLEATAEFLKFQKEKWHETIKYPWQTFVDENLKRQFEKHAILGPAILPENKSKKLNEIISQMQKHYSTVKICAHRNPSKCDLSLEPDITAALKSSHDPEELKHVWLEWHNKAGRPARSRFIDYVELVNEAARLNNFTDNSEYWLKDYESPDFREQINDLWLQLKPLYYQIHAYVRHKLRKQYGDDIVPEKGPIPAHLLGNMWAQSWESIASQTLPYPHKDKVDITSEMTAQKYTPLKMFKLSEEFFTSLGLSPMPETFWERSIIEKPVDREIICHASAWDFYDSKDVRIKQCTSVNDDDLYTAHHEMGHIEYFLQYKDQPYPFREGANPGFHEAVGDVMSLSVSSPKHLRKIGLLKSDIDDVESSINHLYAVGLEKIVFLPFAYAMDLWRWGVFKGEITPDNYNTEWWRLRKQYQGVEPPVNRTENDFDPAAKYHIVADVPYIRYFVSFVVQFQFHKALCDRANEYQPEDPTKQLHMCDIYKSKEAGRTLQKMLKMGSSKPWPEAMEVITGLSQMDAGPLLEYFRPLHHWLEKRNRLNREFIGWDMYEKST